MTIDPTLPPTPSSSALVPLDALRLDYFVEWRQWAWTPAVRWALEPLGRLAGARVLELGPNRGRMSCYLALCGAHVTALELEGASTHDAEREIASWKLEHQVELRTYDGAAASLPPGPFDVVFTKSVLVLLGPGRARFLSELATRLSPGGKLVALENASGGAVHRMARRRLHPNWDHNYGVDSAFIRDVECAFPVVETRTFRSVVTAIRASSE